MANLNKVILLGNLTRDPELRFTPNGSPVAKFRLATNQRVRQQEEWKDEVCYIDVITFGKQAENVAEYLAMGNLALVEGRLHWHEWEGRDGQRRKAVFAVLHETGIDEVELQKLLTLTRLETSSALP